MTTAANTTPAKRRKPRSAYVRVQADGSFRCADEFSREAIRRCKPRPGDLVRVTFSKPRDYQQWLKAHGLGTVIIQNIEQFGRFEYEPGKYDAHAALKELQRLSGVECDDSELEVAGGIKMIIRQPRSLAFEEMDEGTFQRAYSGFCQHIIKTWWPMMDELAIEQMGRLVGMAA